MTEGLGKDTSGEHTGDISDQLRQGPWNHARIIADEMCPYDHEVVMRLKVGHEKHVIAIEDVDKVTAPEEMGEAGKGHSKIHFKEHLGKTALVVATGVVLGGWAMIRKRAKT